LLIVRLWENAEVVVDSGVLLCRYLATVSYKRGQKAASILKEMKEVFST
jgi:hypothetical protein